MSTEPSPILQSSSLPPAQPSYILRGHSAQIHAVHFFWQNVRLLTGDADGWVVLWNVPIKRPAVVWKAHSGSILGIRDWGNERIITHGRDNKLIVWQLNEEDEKGFTAVLPIEDTTSHRKQPWVLHSLPVNALNFCSFAMVDASSSLPSNDPGSPTVLVAVPGVQDGTIAITSLPSEERITTLPGPKEVQCGMVMAIAMHQQRDSLLVVVGYESGHAALWQQNTAGRWETLYLQKPHTQPVLSIDVVPALECFYTSSVDAVIAKHSLVAGVQDTKTMQTKHSGQQSLRVRNDGKIFATAGWDGRARVYSTRDMRELAVLKWHKEGCYALSFAGPVIETDDGRDPRHAVAGQGLTVAERRTAKAKSTNWLALGSKDGKVSLWDIY